MRRAVTLQFRQFVKTIFPRILRHFKAQSTDAFRRPNTMQPQIERFRPMITADCPEAACSRYPSKIAGAFLFARPRLRKSDISMTFRADKRNNLYQAVKRAACRSTRPHGESPTVLVHEKVNAQW